MPVFSFSSFSYKSKSFSADKEDSFNLSKSSLNPSFIIPPSVINIGGSFTIALSSML